VKAAGKINCFFASKFPYIKNVPLCKFLCEKKLELAMVNCKELRLSRIQVLRQMAE